MNAYRYLTAFITATLMSLCTTNSKGQPCDNLALDFDGNLDFVSLNLSGTPLAGDANFTAEAWFTINSPATSCTGNFRRLFTFAGLNNPGSRFELGECNGQLHLFWLNTVGTSSTGSNGPVIVISPPVPPGCHHVALTRNGVLIQIYLDGAATPIYSGPFSGMLDNTLFRVGHWGGGATPGQDWLGTVDEVRLWSVPRTPTEIRDNMDCSLSGVWPNLVANWTFDQPGVTAGGANSTIPGLQATDMSGNGNNGTFSTGANGFALNGSVSNFVCNPCGRHFVLDISNQPDPFPISLVSICNGDPAHFCINENGNAVSPIPGATVSWEYLDGGQLPWLPVPNSNSIFNGYCFFVPKGEINISSDCTNSTTGYVDRKYRAKITKTVNGQTCTFLTSESDLRICCPLSSAQVNTVVQSPLPFNGTLCDDPSVPVSIDVSLTGLSFLNNIAIQWCLNGQPIPGVGNVTSFTYNGPATAPQMCFEAKFQNCSCPPANPSACIPVDPIPMCGIIDGISPNLIHDPNGGPYDYLICPGEDAQVGIAQIPGNMFKNCNPVWQYRRDSDPPGQWFDLLGSSNGIQNTNILPQLSPPNAATSPYLWQANTNCISYRVECRPFNYPNSGCDPCHSNVVNICLHPSLTQPVITASATTICEGSTALLSVPYDPTVTQYEWYCNGFFIGYGDNINVTQNACYWVVAYDGCHKSTSAKVCITVCEVVPIIHCPTDNPCACPGQPITLDGSQSYDTCGSTPLSYSWTTTDGNSGTGPLFTDTPNLNGTTYTLTVINGMGCVGTTSATIVPCQ